MPSLAASGRELVTKVIKYLARNKDLIDIIDNTIGEERRLPEYRFNDFRTHLSSWLCVENLGPVSNSRVSSEVHASLREMLGQIIGSEAQKVRILYGGSVKPGNARELMAVENVDGALVGGASLVAEDFLGIIAACA